MNVTRNLQGVIWQKLGVEPYLPAWLIDYERQRMWDFALKLMHESPWFGLGINTINFQPGADAQIPNTLDLPMISGHPHNWMIEVLVEDLKALAEEMTELHEGQTTNGEEGANS